MRDCSEHGTNSNVCDFAGCFGPAKPYRCICGDFKTDSPRVLDVHILWANRFRASVEHGWP
ncbi:hypothetical protein PBI_ROPE_57 [Mycobacterium phage Rope]|uniref:Uncharacterized protein n=1 Tax=Mycobacterium phage Rope TaxID=2767563 RepID=A0A7G9V0B1_9CAUD|nr:hypothetical protein PBI_ROPE_57 [Mycobacterium phage Rope]